MLWFSLFPSFVRCKFQCRSSYSTIPKYLTWHEDLISWPLMQKLRCLVIILFLDVNITSSILLVFRAYLFWSTRQPVSKLIYLWWWRQIVFVVWLIDERPLALFPAKTIARDPITISNLRHTASRIWACAKPEFKLGWIKLCSSDNHYTTALLWLVSKNKISVIGKMMNWAKFNSFMQIIYKYYE